MSATKRFQFPCKTNFFQKKEKNQIKKEKNLRSIQERG